MGTTGTPLDQTVIAVLKGFLAIAPILGWFIGIVVIIQGIARFAQGNSAPNGGRGAIMKIFTGAMVMNIQIILNVLKRTVEAAGGSGLLGRLFN
jgi:hypothetical protein